jgi:hypothetical protein
MATAPYKTQRRANTTKKVVKSSQPRKNMTKIAACGLHYASALADPVNTPVGACIPYGFPIPSQKIKTFARGTFAIGTQGYGFCVVRPTLANDQNAVLTSTNASVGNAGTTLNAFTATAAAPLVKLPFTTAQITSASEPVEGRLVAMELRVRFAGTEAGRNGIVTTIEEPDHKSLGATSPQFIVTYTPSLNERPPPDGSWHSVKYSGPVAAAEIEYAQAGIFISAYLMGFVIQGIASDLYEWELYIHNEYTGGKVSGMTPSHIDATAYGKVVETYKSITSNGPLNNDSAPSAFVEFVKSAGSSISSMVLDYGVPALAGMISPALVPFARSGVRMLTGK